MALRDVLYRCPVCGHEPTRGRKDHVHCPSCKRHLLRGPPPARMKIESSEGERIVSTRELVRSVRERVLPVTSSSEEEAGEEGSGPREARVKVRWAVGEDTVRYRGELLGFTERLGSASEMRLRLTASAVELWGTGASATRPKRAEKGQGMEKRRWNLLDLRALQASSSSLQIYTLSEELVHMRFLDDSAFRWEGILQETLRAVYREAGKGEIVEFQPRITVR